MMTTPQQSWGYQGQDPYGVALPDPPPPVPPYVEDLTVPSHPIAYSVFTFSLGFAAVSLGTFMHILINAYGAGLPVAGMGAALSLTTLLFAVPFLIASGRYVLRLEGSEPAALDSPVRKGLGTTLLVFTAVVGSVRFFWSLWFLVTGSLVEGVPSHSTGLAAGVANVAVSMTIAGGLGWWVWTWLHKEQEAAHAPLSGPEPR